MHHPRDPYDPFDADGEALGEPCPRCESIDTVTYRYREGFSELECTRCGFSSEAESLSELARYPGVLREGQALPPIPVKKLEA